MKNSIKFSNLATAVKGAGITAAITVASLIISATSASAQTSSTVSQENSVVNTDTSEEADANISAASTVGIAPRALSDLGKEFKPTGRVFWTKCNEGGIIASFKNGLMKTWVYYSKKGFWQYTINRFAEAQLPKDVRKIVLTQYFDYKILGVEEIIGSNSSAYIVHLYNDSIMKKIKVCNDEIEELETYKNFQQSVSSK